MAPTRLGDGTDIDSIRLGDGTEVSEVRTGDGDTVFTAEKIPEIGLVQRYKAEDLTSSFSNGQTPTTWTDKSGNNNNATSNGSPTLVTNDINGKASVSFDGSDDYYTISNITQDNEFSLFAVLKTDPFKEHYIYGGGYNNNDSALFFVSDDGEWDLGTYDGSFSPIDTNTNPTQNYQLYEVVRESDSSTEIFVDGSSIATGTTSTIGQRTYNHHIGYAVPRNKESAYAEMNLAELIRYNRFVGASDRQAIRDYVSNEYGLSV